MAHLFYIFTLTAGVLIGVIPLLSSFILPISYTSIKHFLLQRFPVIIHRQLPSFCYSNPFSRHNCSFCSSFKIKRHQTGRRNIRWHLRSLHTGKHNRCIPTSSYLHPHNRNTFHNNRFLTAFSRFIINSFHSNFS